MNITVNLVLLIARAVRRKPRKGKLTRKGE